MFTTKAALLAERIKAYRGKRIPLTEESRALVVAALEFYVMERLDGYNGTYGNLDNLAELVDDRDNLVEMLMRSANPSWPQDALQGMRKSRPRGTIIIRQGSRVIVRDKGLPW